MADPETVKGLRRLRYNASLSMYCHFGAAERSDKLNLRLGIPLILLNIGLGSVMFNLINNEIPDMWKWISAILALVGAFLSGLQTFFNPKQLKLQHRDLANRYLTIERGVELALGRYSDGLLDLASLADRFEALNGDYDALNRDANDYSTNDDDYERAKQKIRGRKEEIHGAGQSTTPNASAGSPSGTPQQPAETGKDSA